jgi:glycosyltransferase involved in cell wall biosynthesis
VGELAVVGNVTQDLARRGDACGLPFWEAATADLPTMPAGPGSDVLRGGVGALTYDGMRDYLRSVGAYLYTGTRPASYTLGLIEAAMTGVPVVAMGPGNFYPPELYEAHEIVPLSAERPEDAAKVLADLLADRPLAEAVSEQQRSLAVAMFGLDRAMGDWADFLGVPL